MKRKTILLSAILIFVSNYLIGQDFNFNLIFQDAIGNTDTLILGYSPNATDSVDTALNEINIISTELDSVFDVRVTDEWNARYLSSDSIGNFHLKKQIIHGTCGFSGPISIDIKCKNWPVTVSWDNSLFNDTCRDGSVFTSVPAGGWWDVLSPSDLYRAELKNENQVTFTANYDSYLNDSYAYINTDSDTISVFWVVYAKSSFLSAGIQKERLESELNIYPNPATNKIQITGVYANQIEEVIVLDLSGKAQIIKKESDNIDLSQLQNGIYFISIRFKDNKLITRKIIKQ
jgi:hypothetical protein